jgi:hypothetical protein
MHTPMGSPRSPEQTDCCCLSNSRAVPDRAHAQSDMQPRDRAMPVYHEHVPAALPIAGREHDCESPELFELELRRCHETLSAGWCFLAASHRIGGAGTDPGASAHACARSLMALHLGTSNSQHLADFHSQLCDHRRGSEHEAEACHPGLSRS